MSAWSEYRTRWGNTCELALPERQILEQVLAGPGGSDGTVVAQEAVRVVRILSGVDELEHVLGEFVGFKQWQVVHLNPIAARGSAVKWFSESTAPKSILDRDPKQAQKLADELGRGAIASTAQLML